MSRGKQFFICSLLVMLQNMFGGLLAEQFDPLELFLSSVGGLLDIIQLAGMSKLQEWLQFVGQSGNCVTKLVLKVS